MTKSSWQLTAEARRHERRARDLTLNKLSKRIRVAESTLHSWERGKRQPTPEQDAAWAKALEKGK